jgi:hypothetical protein
VPATRWEVPLREVLPLREVPLQEVPATFTLRGGVTWKAGRCRKGSRCRVVGGEAALRGRCTDAAGYDDDRGEVSLLGRGRRRGELPRSWIGPIFNE